MLIFVSRCKAFSHLQSETKISSVAVSIGEERGGENCDFRHFSFFGNSFFEKIELFRLFSIFIQLLLQVNFESFESLKSPNNTTRDGF